MNELDETVSISDSHNVSFSIGQGSQIGGIPEIQPNNTLAIMTQMKNERQLLGQEKQLMSAADAMIKMMGEE